LIFIRAPWPNACLNVQMHSFAVISSLTEKTGDFMKVPHADPLNTTQSSNKPVGFEVNRLPSRADTTRTQTAAQNRCQIFPSGPALRHA
jgi:hypothetical protein